MERRTHHIDWITVLVLLCLGLFGLFILLTIGQSYFVSQLIYLVLGFVLLFAFSYIDPAFLWWFAPIGYIVSNIFLAMSYLGPSIRGATRWILLAGAQIQPSEFVKPFLLLAFAYFMAKYTPRKLGNVPILFVLFALPFLLVFRQPDIGSSLVYAGFWSAMLSAAGLPVWLMISGVAVVGVFLPFLWSHLAPYQQSRILTFLNPSLDPAGAGYNALQAMIAVGSGQWLGRGLGRGTQSHLRFLPEYHTDFIFATLIEELGLLGGTLLLAGYAFLLYRIIAPILHGMVSDTRVFIYSFGLFAMLLSQIFINVGMNMGLIPITGITLPFVSYGGSSILSTAMAFGILWALARGNSDESGIAITHHS
ncbi:MAG: FtsW/RodA/SpoVE family cell cycle protein [Candidatus Gottesmanbacteria bacterium]|nr:FtsW/RodA/SpoVE family cell cycle protein [Candidatus Gottesmanbacteria bacterium]